MKKTYALVLAMMIITSIFTLSAFADEYGTEPYDIVDDWYADYDGWETPSTYTKIQGTVPNLYYENPYTLYIDTANSYGNLDEISIIQYDFNAYNGYRRIRIYQDRSTRLTVSVEYWYEDPEDENNMLSDFEDYIITTATNKYLLIPFAQYYEESPYLQATITTLNTANPNYVQVLNNQQYTTINNRDESVIYQQGHEDGYRDGLEDGYDLGLEQGETIGYQAGYDDAMEIQNLPEIGEELAFAVVQAPVNVLMQIMNFEVLGINVFWTFAGIFTILLVAVIVKRFLL